MIDRQVCQFKTRTQVFCPSAHSGASFFSLHTIVEVKTLMPVQETGQSKVHMHTQTHTWTATVLTHDVQRPEGQENVITSAAGPGIPAWVVPLLQNKLFPTEGPALERQPSEGGRDRITAGVAEQGPTCWEKNRKERHSTPS